MTIDSGRVPEGTRLSQAEPADGLGPTGFDPSREGGALTDAQRSFLLSLPHDGSWRKTSETELNRYGTNALRGFGKTGLAEGYYQEEMRHRLTQRGQSVVAFLTGAEGRIDA